MDSEDRGCLIGVGLIAVSISIGYLHSEPVGWLTFGIGLLLICLTDWLVELWRTRKDSPHD